VFNTKGEGAIKMAENTQEQLSVVPDMRLELVPVPVTDVDRAKVFYVEKAGFKLEVDVYPREGMRVVQMTPPGSACSIVFGTGMGELTDMQPGCVRGIHLVVADIQKSRDALLKRGLEVGEVSDVQGVFYADFRDPDGNLWLLQQFPPDMRR
jgi:catechol 2,3-dioxygenase-like lactoylglutathione lyase family enzyme